MFYKVVAVRQDEIKYTPYSIIHIPVKGEFDQKAFQQVLRHIGYKGEMERPLIAASLLGKYGYSGPLLVSTKKATNSCVSAARERVRLHPEGEVGLTPQEEVKTMVFMMPGDDGKPKEFVMVICPGDRELTFPPGTLSLYPLDRVGLVPYTVNPFEGLVKLEAHAGAMGVPVRVVLEENSTDFVGNNLSERTVSGTFNRLGYFAAFKALAGSCDIKIESPNSSVPQDKRLGTFRNVDAGDVPQSPRGKRQGMVIDLHGIERDAAVLSGEPLDLEVLLSHTFSSGFNLGGAYDDLLVGLMVRYKDRQVVCQTLEKLVHMSRKELRIALRDKEVSLSRVSSEPELRSTLPIDIPQQGLRENTNFHASSAPERYPYSDGMLIGPGPTCLNFVGLNLVYQSSLIGPDRFDCGDDGHLTGVRFLPGLGVCDEPALLG